MFLVALFYCTLIIILAQETSLTISLVTSPIPVAFYFTNSIISQTFCFVHYCDY
jgi:hypothetical protein